MTVTLDYLCFWITDVIVHMAFVSLQMLSILPFYGNNEEIRAEERMRDSVGWVSYVVRSANAFSIQVNPCSIHKMNEECVYIVLWLCNFIPRAN